MTTAVKVPKTDHPVASYVVGEITSGIAALDEGNKVLLGSESGTKVADIDKALKEANGELPENIKVLWTDATSAYETYRKNLEAARNAYRTEVLGEEAKADSTVDKKELQEKRVSVMASITFLKTFAAQNKDSALESWLNTLEVPMAGRKGSSTAGQTKPRVFVEVDGTRHQTFGDAAKALTAIENHAKVTTAELANAWKNAGGVDGEFTFGDHVVNVISKPKKTDKVK